MKNLYLLFICGVLSACNVNTDIEIYSDDLNQDTAANEITTTIRFTSFGDRSMCDMINNQAQPALSKVFKSLKYRECIVDTSGQINAIFDATLPLKFGSTHSNKPAIRIKDVDGNPTLKWVFIDMPSDGLKSLISNNSFNELLAQQDISKTISFKFVNSGKAHCFITASSAYINGVPHTMRDENPKPLILDKRKSASIRLPNVTVDAVSQFSTNLAFMAACPSTTPAN